MATRRWSGGRFWILEWRVVVASLLIGIATLTALAPCVLAAGSPPDKAIKYHEVLARRPSPGYLFDRFYNAWLDESTIEELERFLMDRAAAGKSSDGLMLAFFYAKQGDDLRTLEQFRKTLSDDPGNAAAWYEKAIVEARTLDFDTALADLQRAADAHPDDKLAILIAKLRGKLLVRNRQRGEAIRVWNALLADQPDDEELAEDVVELQIEEALLDEAAELSRSLIERTKDPYQRVVRELRLGDVLDRAGQRAEAIATYRATLQRVGAESWLEREILAQIERVFRREDDLAGLQKEYESLVAAHPRRIGIHRAYARTLSEAGDAQGAIEKFREILKLTPGDRANQEAFIELHVRAADLPGAIKHLQTLIDAHPQDGELLMQLSQLQAKSGDKAASAGTIDKFLTGSDKSEYAYLRAARLLEQLELADAAKEKYAALVAAFPDSVSAQEAQAALLYKIGEKEPALEIWRKLAARADAQQLVRLARALASRNEHELAYEILEKRHAEFAGNWLYLGQLITQGLANKKYAEAVPWALARVEASESSGDLNDAIAQAATVIERADAVSDILRRLQAADHQSLRKSCLVAELLELSADSRQADAALQSWMEKGEPLAVMQQVRLATRRYDWSAAADAMRRLIGLPGERKSQNVRRLIEFYERDFRLEEALNWVAEWKKLSPGSTTPWIAQSRLQLTSGKEDAALDTLRQAAKEFDGNEEIRIQLAQLYSNMGKYADSQRIYWLQFDEAQSLADKLRYVEQLARLAEQQGNIEQLVDRFEERRRSNRQSVEPLLTLATIHRVANNYESRRQALAEASKLKPDDVELLHEIARIEEQEGQWERAKATLEGALALDKTNRTRQRLARLVIQYGDPDEGFAMLYQLAVGEKSDPRDIESVADAMIGAGDWQRAREFLATHVEQHPDDYRLRYLLAIACEEEDDTAAAIDEFIAAMQTDNEIQGLQTASQFGAVPSQYLAQIAEIMPQEAVDIIQFQQGRHAAYNYRQQRSLGAYMATTARGSSTRVLLPSSLEQVRQYALMHLLTIAQSLDDQDGQQLISRLHGAGVANAELLMAVTPVDQRTGQSSLEELLEKFPDRESVRALAVFGMFSPIRGEFDSQVYRDSFEHFAQTRPQLALLAALQGAARDEEAHDLLDHVPALLDRLEKPNSMLLMQLCNYLGVMRHQPQVVDLPDATRKLISKKLIEWYPHARNTPPYGQYIFASTASAIRRSGDAVSFVRLLDDEVARHRGGTGGPQQGQQMYYGRQPEQFLSLPTFPPSELADFPQAVLQLLSRSNQQHDPFGQSAEPAWENADLARLLPQVKDPIFRVLLAAYAEADELVDETLGKLLADKTPMLDAYLLGATRAVSQEKFEDAIRLFDKARYLPMNRTVRRKLDESLVAIALEEAELLKEDADLQQAARDAALRLRHGTMQPDQRTRLIAALEDLGLQREAELLDKKSSVAAASTPPRAVFVQPGQTASQDQIRRLIDQGKRDVAARTLAGEALAMIRQAASNPGNWSYSRYQTRQVRERIASYRLTDDVLAALDPQDSDNHRKWADFGMLNEALEKLDEAQQAYERALELRPKEDPYRARLVLLLSRKDPAAAVALCEGFGRHGAVQIIAELLGRMRDNQDSIDARLELADFAHALFVEQSKSENSDLSWGAVMCDAIGGRMYGRNVNIPPLYVPSSVSDTSGGDRVSKETLTRRQALHDALCRHMLQHSATAEEAFTLLLASREARGEVDDELTELARETLLKTEKPSRAGNPYSQYGGYYSSSGLTVPRRTAAEFLIQHCFKSDDWSALDDEVIPHVTQIGRRDLLDEIAQYRSLFTCEPDEFVRQAEQYVRQAVRRIPQQSRYQGREPEQLVCEAWQARKLDVDLQPLVLKFAEQSKRSGMSHQAPGYLLRYAAQLAENGQSERAVEFYEELARIYLGPKDKRAEFITRNYDRRSISSNSPNAQIHAYAAILQAGLGDQRLLEPTMQFVRTGEVASIVQNYEHHLRRGLKSAVAEREPEEVVEYLEQMGLLGGVAEFAQSGAATAGGNESVVSLTCVALRELHRDKQDKVKQLLRDRRPQTFGVRAVFAHWGLPDDRRALLEHTAQEIETLRELDAESARLVSENLKKVVRAHNTASGEHSESVQALLDWISEQSEDQGRALADAILAAKRYEDLKVPGHDAEQWLAEIVSQVVEHDPEQAGDIYFHVAKLHEEGQSRHAVSMHYSNSAVCEMLPRMMWRISQDDASRTLLLLAVLDHQKARDVSFTFQQLDQMTVPIRRKYTNLIQEFRRQKKPAGEFLAEYRAWLAEALHQRVSPVLLTSFQFSLNLSNPNPVECSEMEAWLKERIAADPADQLSGYMLTALQRFVGKRDRGAALKGQPAVTDRFAPAEYHRCFEELLADEAVSLPTRLVLAEMLFNEESERLPLATALAIAQLGNEACATKIPFQAAHHHVFARNALGLVGEADQNELILAYVKAWHERFGRRGRPQSTYPRSPDVVTDGAVLAQVLALYLRLAEEAALNQFIRQHEQPLGSRREAIPLLVAADRPDVAERLLRTQMPHIHQSRTPPLVEYTALVAEKSQSFFASIPEEQARYFAQVLVASLPNPKPVPDGVAPRKKRLLRAAKEFAGVSWKSPELRDKTLLMLCDSEPALAVITDDVISAADDVDFVAMANGNQTGAYYNELVELVGKRIELGLAAGDAAPLARFIDQTLGSSLDNDWQVRNTFQRKSSNLATAVATHLHTNDEEFLRQLAESIRSVVAPPPNMHIGNLDQWNALCVIAHLRTGQSKQFRQWHGSLDPQLRNRIKQNPFAEQTWGWLANSFATLSDANLEERLTAAAGLLRLAESLDWLLFGDDLKMRLSGRSGQAQNEFPLTQLFSNEELIAEGDRLVDLAPARGATACSLANFHEKAKRWGDASGFWEQALAATPEEPSQTQKRTRVQIRHAHALWHAGHAEQAQQVVAQIETKNMPADVVRSHKELQNQLRTANPVDEEPAADEPDA